MCHNIEAGSPDFDPTCKCHMAVMRAYTTLLSAGTPESRALEAAKIVYSHHHPEDSKDMAALTVERWVYAAHIH